MGKLFTSTALLFILAIDVFLFMGATAMVNINPAGNITLMQYDKSLLSTYDAGGYVLKNASANDLPNQGSTVAETTGETIFTDPLTVIKNFFLDTLGFNYVVNILGGPTPYIVMWGLPIEFTYAIGAFWYGVTFFMVISFFFGKE